MIQVTNLRKVFGSIEAVRDVTFAVEKGEVLGFLGPNGAGKSTTMRIITGFFPATAGEVRVGGHDVAARPIEAKRLMGYLPENAPCYADMTVRGFLKFCGTARGLRGRALRAAVDRAIETCFLGGVVHQSIETLSKGYRHRTCLAQAILHDPDVLILDEPTDGLDPNQKHEVRSLIRRMARDKVIVFSTHILEEVEAVCTRAIIIDRGRIVANGTPAGLKQRAWNAGRVLVTLAGGDAEAVAAKLRTLEGCGGVEVLDAARLRLRPAEEGAARGLSAAVCGAAAREGWRLEEVRLEEGRLDDVFRSLTMESADDAPGSAKEVAA